MNTTRAFGDDLKGVSIKWIEDDPSLTESIEFTGMSASSTHSGFGVDKLQNDDFSTYWLSESANTTNQWIQFDYASPGYYP